MLTQTSLLSKFDISADEGNQFMGIEAFVKCVYEPTSIGDPPSFLQLLSYNYESGQYDHESSISNQVRNENVSEAENGVKQMKWISGWNEWNDMIWNEMAWNEIDWNGM